ncbi:MAG: hypothetical protein H6587_11300 [Flavobacteriales bacterium]|nr:hypothetical protein [Flavobacteriales bacterium]MCB9365146.1 hypothetical protein [Flavobacteriales bacterium]
MDISTELKAKQNSVERLIKLMEETEDDELRKETILLLVDNFKDERISVALKKMILNPKYYNQNAFFVYALGENANCKDDFLFLIDLIINGDYHVALNAFNIILDISNPIDNELLNTGIEKLKNNKEINIDKYSLVIELKQHLHSISN